MIFFEDILLDCITEYIESQYGYRLQKNDIIISPTNKNFKGDFSLALFSLSKKIKKNPIDIAREIVDKILSTHSDIIQEYNLTNGFLNIILRKEYLLRVFNYICNNSFDNLISKKNETIVIEFSSPNTNKPLHLGHIRNNVLGLSLSRLLESAGNKVYKVNLVNDRGIHICKSMLAWIKWGNGETPENSGMKGDKLVGKYYVLFENMLQEEIQNLPQEEKEGLSKQDIAKKTQLMKEAQELLRKWEKGDEEVRKIWAMMNNWVYEGFDKTYKHLDITFDKIYYESDIYNKGKTIVEEAFLKNIFGKKEDGSIYVDLSEYNLDEKILLRADGTSVYITQDIGVAYERYHEYTPDRMIYVVGNEQNYHFEVLKTILKNKLNQKWADIIYHYSYGMVELPEGKMKSREGKVVDADDLIEEMMIRAEERTKLLGKTEDLPPEQLYKLYFIIAIGAIKYYILKVAPEKNIMFNPEESIDFDGNTAPFIQYTYARIQSVLRKAKETNNDYFIDNVNENIDVNDKEKELLINIYLFSKILNEAIDSLSPNMIANYIYELAKLYNQYYHDYSILKAGSDDLIKYRLLISKLIGNIIKYSMYLLGIEVPEKM